MKFLQQVQTEALKEKQTIIQRLMKDVAGYEKARSHKTVHASDITRDAFCPRQTALLDLSGLTKKDEYINTAQRVTYDVGNVMSDLFREKWAAKWTYGNWRCARCGECRTFCLKPSGVMCKVANHKQECSWKYEEMAFVSQSYDVSGSLDAVVDLGAPKLFITELKIMAPTEFEKLIAPLPEHRIRTTLYMKLVEDSNSVYKPRLNLSTGKVLYVSRAWGKMHKQYNEILPFKEYNVERDDDALIPALAKAQQVRDWRKNKKMPVGICDSSAVPYAKKCSVCSLCFSGKYPPS